MLLCDKCKARRVQMIDPNTLPAAKKRKRSGSNVDISNENSALERIKENERAMSLVPPDTLVQAVFRMVKMICDSRDARTNASGRWQEVDLTLDLPNINLSALGLSHLEPVKATSMGDGTTTFPDLGPSAGPSAPGPYTFGADRTVSTNPAGVNNVFGPAAPAQDATRSFTAGVYQPFGAGYQRLYADAPYFANNSAYSYSDPMTLNHQCLPQNQFPYYPQANLQANSFGDGAMQASGSLNYQNLPSDMSDGVIPGQFVR